MFGLGMGSMGSIETSNSIDNGSIIIVVGEATTPFVEGYLLNLADRTIVKFDAPSTLPAGEVRGASFTPGGTLTLAVGASPGNKSYPMSAAGFGEALPDRSEIIIGNNRATVSRSGTSYAQASNGSPYGLSRPWDEETGIGASFTTPSPNLVGAGYGVVFAIGDTHVIFASRGTPFLHAYAFSNATGIGAKVSALSPALDTLPFGLAMTPSGAALITGLYDTPYVAAVKWTGSGFGARYANPATLPTGTVFNVAISPDGKSVLLAASNQGVIAYAWDDVTGFGAKFADPTSKPAPGSATSVAFSDDGTLAIVGYANSDFLAIYEFNSTTGFGARISIPSLPLKRVDAVAVRSA